MKTPKPDFTAILAVLNRHEVDFIVVGGVCGVLHGAPISTLDLDVVHSRSPINITRLLAALNELGAYYRTHPDQRIRPTGAHLGSPGHLLLMTAAGPLDLLGAVGKGRGYDDLVGRSAPMRVGAMQVRALDLEALIEIKEEVGHEKDLAVLAILRRTLEEKRKG